MSRASRIGISATLGALSLVAGLANLWLAMDHETGLIEIGFSSFIGGLNLALVWLHIKLILETWREPSG